MARKDKALNTSEDIIHHSEAVKQKGHSKIRYAGFGSKNEEVKPS